MTLDNRTGIALSILLIIITTFIAFSPSLKNGFVYWDDYEYIVANSSIKQLSIENIKTIFGSSYVSNYQPLSILTYALEYSFFKLNPEPYHATNILIHILNCLLVFWIFMLISGRISISLVTALFFGLHPLRVESVAWAAERKDVLYAFFFLASGVSYLYYIRKNQLRYYYSSFLLFFLSVLSKAMAVTLPVIFFLIDYLLQRKPCKKIFVEKIPFFILSLIFGYAAIVIQNETGAVSNLNFSSVLYRVQIAFLGLISYLNKMLFPVNLSAAYPYPDQNLSFQALTTVSFLTIIVLGCIVFFSTRFTRKMVFGSLFFLLTILPVLQIIPVGYFFMADRYTYVPSIGLAYIFSEGLFWLYHKKYEYENISKRLQIIVLSIFILLLAFLTYQRNKLWKDDFVLWNNTLKNYPQAYSVYIFLGQAYNEKGDFEKAIECFNKSTGARILKPINDMVSKAYINAGYSYFKKEDFDRAIDNYNKAIDIKPNGAEAYYNRGNAYFYKKDFDSAISDYNTAIQLMPDNTDIYNNRANVYIAKQEYDKAWQDVHKIESLGGSPTPALLEELKKVSGQEE